MRSRVRVKRDYAPLEDEAIFHKNSVIASSWQGESQGDWYSLFQEVLAT